MEIESKLDEDRIVTIKKEPEVGDLVVVNRQWDKQAQHYIKELGLVKATWEASDSFSGEDYPTTALVHWLTTDDEEECGSNYLLTVQLKEKN